MNPSLLQVLILFFTGLFASLFGSLVGGAAFITIPIMASLGIPLPMTLAANTFGNLGINIGGFNKLHKEGLINYKLGLYLAFFAFFGSMFGSDLVLKTPATYIKVILIFALIISLFSLFIKPKKGIIQGNSKKISIVGWIFGAILAMILGAYAGFLGAGVATFYTYGLIFIFNQSFLESTGTRKIPGLIQAIGGTIVFLINKKVDLLICLPLFFGMYLGSEIGTHYGIKFGNKFIKILSIIITIILLVKFLG